MSVKAALERFFDEMTQDYIRKNGCPPKALCSEERKLTGLFLLDTLDDAGFAQWAPKPQHQKHGFDQVEQELGFQIHKQIRAYLSEYWFLPLDGKLLISDSIVFLRLIGVTKNTDLHALVMSGFQRKGTHDLPEHHDFLLGTYCVVDGDDGFTVQVDNETGEVRAVDPVEHRSVHLADSIEDLLLNLKTV